MDDFEDFIVESIIGSGSFGTCYKVKHKSSLKVFVWKAVNYGQMSEDEKQSVVSEVNVLSKLKHPNIIRYYDHIIHKKTSTLYIIMEYCSGGDLAKIIKQCVHNGQYLHEHFIWRTLYQIASALNVCHSRCTATVLHRDIKPANVFLDSNYNVKLGDFGLAKILQEKSYADTFVGTPLYMSPEQMKNKKYDKKSDIWALGCLIYETCALKPPFMGNDLNVLSSKIKQGNFKRIPEHYTQDLYKMIEYMLSTNTECRPTIDIILRHPTVVSKSSKQVENIFISSQSKPPTEKSKQCLENYYTSSSKISDKIENLEMNLADNLKHRLENIVHREAVNRVKEEKLNERERLLKKREKKVVLLERLANEKIARANLYLKQSKENLVKTKSCDELETSYSVAPDDSVVEFTSKKIDETVIPKPKGFVRSKSERRVHFNAHKIFQDNSDQVELKEYDLYENEPPIQNQKKTSFRRSVLKSFNRNVTESRSSIWSKSSSNNSEECKSKTPGKWSEENKKCAFSLLKLMNAERDKENIHSKITHTKL